MSKIIRIDITDNQRRRAKELYDFNALNHSFTNGRGNMTGALGEIMVFDYYNPQLKFDNTFVSFKSLSFIFTRANSLLSLSL